MFLSEHNSNYILYAVYTHFFFLPTEKPPNGILNMNYKLRIRAFAKQKNKYKNLLCVKHVSGYVKHITYNIPFG